MPHTAEQILVQELMPEIARQWGEECSAACSAGYRLRHLCAGFHSGYQRGRNGELVRTEVKVKYSSKEAMISDVESLIIDIQQAKLPNNILIAARNLEQSAREFNFRQEYRKRDSQEHEKLVHQCSELFKLVEGYFRPQFDASESWVNTSSPKSKGMP